MTPTEPLVTGGYPVPTDADAPATSPDCHRFCAALHVGKPHDPYYLGMANTVLSALLDEPAEERMRLMGMRRDGCAIPDSEEHDRPCIPTFVEAHHG